MAAAVKALYEKKGVNFKTSVFQITLSGNFPAAPGETVTLTSAAPDPGAVTFTGPNAAAPIPLAVRASQIGGYEAQFTPTATPGQYNLAFYTSGGSILNAGAYPTSISGGVLTVEVDHFLQGY